MEVKGDGYEKGEMSKLDTMETTFYELSFGWKQRRFVSRNRAEKRKKRSKDLPVVVTWFIHN